MISRRSFLIGVGAAASVPAIARTMEWPLEAEFRFSKLAVAKRFDWAQLCEVNMSSYPVGDDERRSNHAYVNYSFIRGEKDTLLTWGLHPLAFLRWVAAPGFELIITKESPVRFDIEPSYSGTILTLIYNVEKNSNRLPWSEAHDRRPYSKNSDGWVGHVPYSDIKRPICFSETFRHRGNELEDHQIHALDPADEHLIG